MNTTLSTWQLVIMAVVPLTALIGWIVAIFIAAREPGRPQAAPAVPASPVLAAVSGPAGPAAAGESEPRAEEPVAA
jgi:hypothetical protein